MADDLKFLLWYLVPLLAAICSSNGQCISGRCEKSIRPLKPSLNTTLLLMGMFVNLLTFPYGKNVSTCV